jgi:tetratricopeptide (TPR) repeat protein
MHPDFDLSSQIRRFEDQYARNPGSLIFARLADLHRKAGSPRRALEVLDEGLERHPEYLSAHIVRARTLQALDRPEEAEASYHRVLALDRQNLVALRALAELARERGDLSEARERYERLLQVDPRNDRARARLRELRGSGTASRPTPAPTPEPGPGGRVEPAEDREELADEVRRIVADVRERFGKRGEDEVEEPDAAEEPKAEEAPDAPEVGSDARATSTGERTVADEATDAEDAGDAAVGAVDASETAAPAEEESPPSDEDEVPTTPDGETEGEGLVTETLAQLYASQGFHEEAVQMYEEMARERPNDPELRARLKAVRARARGEEPEEPPPPLERVDRRLDAGQVDDGSGGGGRGSRDGGPLSGSGEVGGDGRSARAGTSSPVPAEAPTPTARQHLRALLRGEAIPGYANQLLREARGDVDGED